MILKRYDVEFTDTFGAEANYAWVERFNVDACNSTHAITLAKQHRYRSPVPRHTKSDYGDMVRIDIVGSCVCAFIKLAEVQPEPIGNADYLKPDVYTEDELKAGLDKARWCVRCGARKCLCIDGYP